MPPPGSWWLLICFCIPTSSCARIQNRGWSKGCRPLPIKKYIYIVENKPRNPMPSQTKLLLLSPTLHACINKQQTILITVKACYCNCNKDENNANYMTYVCFGFNCRMSGQNIITDSRWFGTQVDICVDRFAL